MARNRMIKPEFWSSETLNRVSLESRLLFIGIWNFCDDFGFCLNNTRQILGNIFPVDEKVTERTINTWLIELVKENLLIPLEYKGKKLLFVKSWGEHQKVANKSKRSFVELTDLERVIKDTLDTNESLISNYLDTNDPKRKKKEKEKEKEKEKDESNKDHFRDCVLLSKGEYDKLLKKYKTEVNLNWAIDTLNNYKMSNNKKYTSDYHVLIGWVFDKFSKDSNNNQPQLISNDTETQQQCFDRHHRDALEGRF